MKDDLATIATFWNPVEANIAKGRLESAGISSFLDGEEVVTMNWPLGNAMGGVKLQVAAADAERATACLAERRSVTGNELAQAAIEAEVDPAETDEKPHAAMPSEEDFEPPPTAREQNADRAWRGAALGLLFTPLQFYVFYLLVKIWLSSEERLQGEHRRHAWMAATINLPCMIIFCLLVKALLMAAR